MQKKKKSQVLRQTQSGICEICHPTLDWIWYF